MLVKRRQNLAEKDGIRASPSDVFYKKGVFRNFEKFTGKHLRLGLFLNKVEGWPGTLFTKKTQAQVFSCGFCEISQNTFLTEHVRWLLLEEWLEEFLEGKDAFYNGNDSDDSDNDDENYNENNEQHQLPEGFANSYCKTDASILLEKLINHFPVCKHCSGTL